MDKNVERVLREIVAYGFPKPGSLDACTPLQRQSLLDDYGPIWGMAWDPEGPRLELSDMEE